MATGQTIQIRLTSFDHKLINKAAGEIVQSVKKTGAHVSGPVPLPTKFKRITILASPHVDKDARDQYEWRTHTRLIRIIDTNHNTVEALAGLGLAGGVEVQIKVVDAEEDNK